MGRADQVLDGDECVAGGLPAGRRAARQVDRDSGAGKLVVRRVRAGATVDQVAARAALQRIVVRLAKKQVVAVQPDQRVVAALAMDLVGVDRAGDGLAGSRARIESRAKSSLNLRSG